MAKCKNCDGTGYDSAARRAGMLGKDLPFDMIPLGVWQCDSCGGTGKEWEPPEFTKEESEEILTLLKEALESIGRRKLNGKSNNS